MTQLQAITNLTRSSLSAEPIYIDCTAQIPGAATPENISADPVSFAFKPTGVRPDVPPGVADWTAGAIVTVPIGTQTAYLAFITVGGPGTSAAVQLDPGEYVIWIYLSDALGNPVAQVGTLTITDL